MGYGIIVLKYELYAKDTGTDLATKITSNWKPNAKNEENYDE
jgi:hypothetical protein